MDLVKICRYCGANYQRDTEHVFPYGLGGQNLYMDCVCESCNNKFAGLERELYQKSYVGLMRSTEGVEGYAPNKQKPAPFKAPTLLTIDHDHKIVYEVGQYYRMQTFVRPQLQFIDSKYYLESDTTDGIKDLFNALRIWREQNLTFVSKDDSTGKITITKFIHHGTYYAPCSGGPAVKLKAAIQFFHLPETHELYPYLSPRLFIDDDKRLKVRSKSVAEAITFLTDLLTYTLQPTKFNSYGPANLDNVIISVAFSFDQLKVEQALVKIGLNCLMYYYPYVKENPALADKISYVKHGSPGITGWLEKKNSIKDSNEGTHNLFFYQLQNSFVIRISLFNGHFPFSFLINNLNVLKHGEYNRLVVDYKNRLNTFQDTKAFFRSFVPLDRVSP